MGGGNENSEPEQDPDRSFAIGLARAFGAAVVFSLPLLMTMEMWWLGFYMDRFRLALFTILMLPLLVGLDYYSGFEGNTESWTKRIADGFSGYGVGFIASAAALLLLGTIDLQTGASEALGKVTVQAIPASFGAILARSQLSASRGEDGDVDREPHGGIHGYLTELLLMTAGAVFLAFNVAPTDEMVVLGVRMGSWRTLAIAAVSMALMHAFVYALEFRGGHPDEPEMSEWSTFARFTVVGYAISLLVSAYVLWTFGRFEGQELPMVIHLTVVLAFPASLGASAARLIV